MSDPKSLPHSKTVRGTLSNPNPKSVKPAQLGDPISLEREKNDAAPTAASDSQPADPYRQNESQLPHSKAVRGTLGNASGPKVNKSMLGDPISLKAETSERGFDRGAAEDGVRSGKGSKL